jgi:SAM-dependent methyltransferase
MSSDDVGFDATTYGERFADVYDDWYADITDVVACTTTLARLAGSRPVLELGVGTGRLAIPLAERGIEVVGVDSSPAMLVKLAAKPGSDRVEAVLGDMADPPVGDRRFGLVFVAFNTFFNLTSGDEQQRCLDGVAGLLDDGAQFVLEAFAPPDDQDGSDRTVVPTRLTTDRVVLTATIHDRPAQTITGQHIDITEAGTTLRPWKIRYASPDQLDVMAEKAGLALVDRWAGWSGEPFGPDSPAHVSVYTRASGHP